MTRCSFRSDSPPRLRANPLLLTSALALVLSALPVSISSETPTWHWQSALARGGPGGGGPGGGSHGGGGGAGGLGADPGAYGRDNAKQGHAYGREQNGSDGRGQSFFFYRDTKRGMKGGDDHR